MLKPGDVIGPYTLSRFLGSGSFGEVWLGENVSPVTPTAFAIKIAYNPKVSFSEIKKEADIWNQVSDHPNILPLIEANQYGRYTVLVSHYRREGSLQEWIAKHKGSRPPTESALNMTLGILAGLRHLHDAKIIHRDLKPANILLQKSVPQLADFGLSGILRSTSVSSTVAGTPAYMAPEAFGGGRTAQADVWSVGVIFYEMLSGRLPFTGADEHEMMDAVRKRPPAPLPSTVPLPIRKVVEKALQKSRAKRYRSTAEMRKALLGAAKLLSDGSRASRTALIGATSAGKRTWSPPWLTRAPRMSVTLGAVVILGMTWAILTMVAGSRPSRRDEPSSAVLTKVTPGQSTTPPQPMTAQAQPNQPLNIRDRVASISFAPDGRTLAAAVFDGTVRMWDSKSGSEMRTLKRGKFGVISVAFSPDGRLMANMDSDALISLWDMRAVEVRRTLSHNPKRGFGGDTGAVLFSPDGRLLASIHHDGELKLWDVLSGNLIRSLGLGFEGSMPSLTFSPDGRVLASGNGDWGRETSGEVRLWSTRTGELLRTLKPEGARNWVMSLAFSPDGKTLAAGTYNSKIAVWNALTGELTRVLTDNLISVRALAFSPDGKTLASGSNDKLVRLWDTRTWEVRNSLAAHSGPVEALAFSPDGKMFASGGDDNSVIIWDALKVAQRLKLQARD